MIHPFGVYAIKTDNEGATYLDPKYHGAPAKVMDDVGPWSDRRNAWVEAGTTTLDRTKENEFWVTVHIPRGRAAADEPSGDPE